MKFILQNTMLKNANHNKKRNDMNYFLGEIWIKKEKTFWVSAIYRKVTQVLIKAEDYHDAEIKMKVYTDQYKQKSGLNKEYKFIYFVIEAI